jgi:hypothetical protein
MLAEEVRVVFEEQLAAVEVEGEEDVAARLEALPAADRVDLSQVLALKPKPRRPPGSPELPETGPARRVRVELFPALMVNAINEVLYERHGFRRSQQHGEPREGHITTLLEAGEGSPVAMGILYTEVCKRVGLPVAGMPIEDAYGHYYVLWPTKYPFKVGGEEYLIDPYGNGDLLQKYEPPPLLLLPSLLHTHTHTHTHTHSAITTTTKLDSVIPSLSRLFFPQLLRLTVCHFSR